MVDYSNKSHYLDCLGHIHPVENTNFSESTPSPIYFRLRDDRIISLFLANNPVRASSSDNSGMKIFQNCIFCGTKRFENLTFNGTAESFKNYTDRCLGKNLLVCKEKECQLSWLDFNDNIDADKLYSIFRQHENLPEFVELDANYIDSLSIKSARK